MSVDLANLGSTGVRRLIRWEYNGQVYSLTGLTRVLNDDYDVQWPGKTCRNWRLQGQQLTLWDEAEQYERG